MSDLKHKLEHFVDKAIPYCLVALIIIIVLEFGFKHTAEKYHLYIEIADAIIVFVFVLDLIFKYLRIKRFSTFLRKSWLDILAVFPFFLLFRLFEEVSLLLRLPSVELKEGQMILHSGLELEKEAKFFKEGEIFTKEGSRIIREVEEAGKVARSGRFARFIRPLARTPRIIKAVPFYEKPSHNPFLKRKRKK